MTVVANLVAKITADSTGFKRGVSGATSALSQLGSLLPAISVGAVGGFIKHTIDAADELRDLAIKTNTSTEFLSRMQYVAGQTGVNFGTFSGALTKMNVGLLKLSTNDKATEKLKSLGIDVAALVKLKPEDQFNALAKALSGIADPAARTAAAIQIFGRSGAELNKIFAEGPANIAAMTAEADKFGLTVGTNAAAAADRANDALGRLKGAFSGLAGGLVREYLPPIADFIELFARGLPAVFRTLGAFKNVIGELIGGTAAAVVQTAKGNFAGAGAILNSTDILDNFDNLLGENETQTAVLKNIDRSLTKGVPAVAQ